MLEFIGCSFMTRHASLDPSHHMIVERGEWSSIIQARKSGVSWDNLRTRNGLSAVGMAIFERSALAVRMMLELGCPLDTENLLDGSPFSPLWSALDKRLPAVMDLLLQAGADPNETHPTLISPIYYASQQGWVEEALVLCKHGCIPNVDIQPSPLKMWVEHLVPYQDMETKIWHLPDTEPVVALLNRGAVISEDDDGVDEISYARSLWFQHPLSAEDQSSAHLTLAWMEHNLLTATVSNIPMEAKTVRKM